MPVDIFPYIDIPVISVVWQYGGLSPEEMEKRVVNIFERSLTTTVNDIEHMESQSLQQHRGHVKILFPAQRQDRYGGGAGHRACPDTVRIMPPGIVPPSILKYDAPAFPSFNSASRATPSASSRTLRSRQQLHPHALRTVKGASVLEPFRRQIAPGDGRSQSATSSMAKQLSARRCLQRAESQNLILPTGTAKLAEHRISRSAEQQPATISKASTTCRSRPSTAPPSI